MKFNELLDSYDKKFYKLSEIEEIAKKEAEKHKQKRNKLSKISHFMGSQQTSIDLYKDMNREIKLRENEADPLEKIAGLVQALLVVKKCDLISSFKTAEYKDAFNKFLAEYLAETKSFVEQEYQVKFGTILLNHLKDALSVLREYGDVKAEKRLEELPTYEKLLATYQELTSKLNSLLINFNPVTLEECISLLSLLKESELSAQIVKEITSSLQNLYNKIIYKAKRTIEEERSSITPSIHAVNDAIDNYLNLRGVFSKAPVELGKDNYSALKEELLVLLEELRERAQHILKLAKCSSKKEANILDSLTLHLTLLKEIDQYLDKYNYPYIEVKEEDRDVQQLKLIVDDKVTELKALYIKNLKERVHSNSNLSISEQLTLWRDLEQELTLNIRLLEDKKLAFSELVNLKEQIPQLRQRYTKLEMKRYNFSNHYLKEYRELLKTIVSLIPSEESEDAKIGEFLEQIDYFKQNITDIIQTAKKLEETVTSQNNPLLLHDEYQRVKEFISKYQASFIGYFKDTCKELELLNTIYLTLENYVNSYISQHAWQGNIIFQAPNTQAKVILLDKPQVIIGRANSTGNLISNNRISLPWSRISGNHLQIDFQEGTIQDLESSNGTYLNKIPSKISSELLTKVTEFNLATDLTFKSFYEPTAFSGFFFTNFSTNHDKALPHTSKNRINSLLQHCFFIYLHPENSETKLFIRKYDGTPIYGNEMLDYNDCFIIQRSKGTIIYSDHQAKIIELPIMKTENPEIMLKIIDLIL